LKPIAVCICGSIALFGSLDGDVHAKSARRSSPRIVKVFSVKQSTKKPTFYGNSRQRILDRGRLLYIGRGMWDQQHVFYLADLKTLTKRSVTAPLAAFWSQATAQFPGAAGSGFKALSIERLLFYDTQAQAAGLLVATKPYSKRKWYYLAWDLKQNLITTAVLLGGRRDDLSYTSFASIGFVAENATFYMVRLEREKGTSKRSVTLLAIKGAKMREQLRFATQRGLHSAPWRVGIKNPRRVLIPEYAELPVKGDPPKGYLVDLIAGTKKDLEIPVTPYGVAYSQGKRPWIYVYSAQLGELWRIDPKTGKRVQKLAVGKRAHALGFIKPGLLMLVRNKGLQPVAVGRRLRKRRMVPLSRYFKGLRTFKARWCSKSASS
jgi:hypothetical protein